MDMDEMIHQRIDSLKKLNKLVDLIENLYSGTYVSISNMLGWEKMNHEFKWPSTNDSHPFDQHRTTWPG